MKIKLRIVICLIILFNIFIVSYGSDFKGEKSDVILQAYTWNSSNLDGTWYNTIQNSVSRISEYFDVVLLPPPSISKDSNGYLPTKWYDLNSRYGSQGDLQRLVEEVKNSGMKTIGELVINHRCGINIDGKSDKESMVFNDPAMYPWENFINREDDEVGECDVVENYNGNKQVEGTWEYLGREYKNKDYPYAPDLSHSNISTRREINKWLEWLKDEKNAGFDGWNFHFADGFSPEYLLEYSESSNSYMSIADVKSYDRQKLSDYSKSARKKVLVYDYPLKNALNKAFSEKEFDGSKLSDVGPSGSFGFVSWKPGLAVTFVENNETGDNLGISKQENPMANPYNNKITYKAAYAYILTHPGIPQIYWAHWREQGDDLRYTIKKLIDIRKNNGVRSDSEFNVELAELGVYSALIGEHGQEMLAIKIGNVDNEKYLSWEPNEALKLSENFEISLEEGIGFKVYYKNKIKN